MLLTRVCAAVDPSTLLIEAEAFQFTGDWTVESDAGTCGGKTLRTIAAEGDALTVVNVPTAGEYRLWVRSRDYPENQPGKRRFTLVLDDEPVATEAGAHGKSGYAWEQVGVRVLEAGPHLLALRDTARFYARCDAVILTSGDLDPNHLSVKELARYRISPEAVEARPLRRFPRAAAVDATTLGEPVTVESDQLQLTFRRGRDVDGKPVVVRGMTVKAGASWIEVPIDAEAERLFMLHSQDSGLSARTYYPIWSHGRDQLVIDVNGRRYETSAGHRSPFWAADPVVLTPRAVRAVDPSAAEVTYVASDGRRVTGRWSVAAGRSDARLELVYDVDRDGEYSLGFSGFRDWPREAVAANLVPPMFNFQRIPDSPMMVTSSVAPHPLVLVQPRGGEWAYGLVADPAQLPMQWPEPDNARYGFTQVNADGQVQPTIFQPVLGMPDSKLTKGQTLRVAWHVVATRGDWRSALEYASEQVLGVTDYRQPQSASLSDAALNMVDLIKHDVASGWDAELRGYHNIEAAGVVTQAAPLAVLSAAILTQDENLWATRALPTIEYTLSRPGAHFALAVPTTFPPYVSEQSIQLRTPGDFYGTAYWQGVHTLLGKANPWIAELAMPDGDVRHKATNVAMPRWSELLAAYRLDPTMDRLGQVQREADAWIEQQFVVGQREVLDSSPFYNMSFYPYWWDLIDLYEITHETRYLDAAEQGAFHTIAGQWSHPRPTTAPAPAPAPGSTLTIHPGGEFKGNDHLWWRGQMQYRLGYPRKPGDSPEKTVPAWSVSNVGLGFEQPSTYFGGGSGAFQMIMMSNWSPHLLRVYEHTGRDIYRTYARNAIIGRFANYPGYYHRGFTDLMQSPDYPYRGPDVTSIYYHHIPCQLLFTLDWLVTDVQVRSGGRIRFPYVKQQGYVWFVNRVFGGEPGRVFDDEVVALRLDRDAAAVDDPAINVLLGRGAERAYVMLTNDAPGDVTATLTLDPRKLGLREGEPMRVLDATGRLVDERAVSASMDVTVSVRGLMVLSLPAESKREALQVPSVAASPIRATLPGDWTQMHAFRIRSPFGRDALYVVLMGWPAEGAAAELLIDGQDQPLTDERFPHEFSVYPLPIERDATFSLRLRDAQGHVHDAGPFTLPGSPAKGD